MVLVERRLHLLGEQRLRVALDARAALLQHDVALRPDHRVGQDQVAHPVGLELHHGAQRARRDGLVIGGVVVRGEGVLAAADVGDSRVELAGLVVGRALEHQMFEEMRDAGLAGRLVGAADLVPDHVRDERRAMVGNDDDFHAVVEQEVLDAVLDWSRLFGEGDGRLPDERQREDGHGGGACA